MSIASRSPVQPDTSRTPEPAIVRRSRWGRSLRRLAIPLVTIAVLIGLWQLAVWGLGVPSYIVPAPTEVWTTMVAEWGTLMQNLAPTAIETGLGFLLGNGIAIVLAVLFVHFKPAERALFPVAIFFRTIPIVAIAPVLVIMLGTGYAPKVVVAALISFFPTLVNMVRGLQAVDSQTIELMKVLSASRREVFFKVRLFASLPFLFSSLKIAATSAVIGAVVAEWIGSSKGLGYIIVQATFNYRTAELYAAMVVTSLFATACFLVVGVLERLIVRWNVDSAP
jgi:NitT/TauT family transport system permease protein